MIKWEYSWFIGNLGGMGSYKDENGKVVELETDKILNKMGSDGWELILAEKRISDSAFSEKYAYFFKRKLSK